MGRWVIFIIIASASLSSCDYYLVNAHKDRVGHLESGTGLGPPDFKPCFEELLFPHYYARDSANFRHGKDSLKTYFHSHFQNYGITNESGYITLRFIINCEGDIGNFHVLQTGNDYSEKEFHPQLVSGLMNLTTDLKDWAPYTRGDSTFDSFKHLTFKIENGELVEILP